MLRFIVSCLPLAARGMLTQSSSVYLLAEECAKSTPILLQEAERGGKGSLSNFGSEGSGEDQAEPGMELREWVSRNLIRALICAPQYCTAP